MTILVAIDGPAGSGKSTLARSLARSLGVPYVNTGLMYRAVAARSIESGIAPDDAEALSGIARRLRFALGGQPAPVLLIDGRPPDPALTSPDVETIVSEVSSHPEVRGILRREQRRLAEGGGVMEGRDIGTVVLPEADVKIFLAAAPHSRADRRRLERGGDQEAGDALATRDAVDSKTNPLVPAKDAWVLDTTSLSADEVYGEAKRRVLQATEGTLDSSPGDRSQEVSPVPPSIPPGRQPPPARNGNTGSDELG
jgi:cytidylate kinase